MKEHLCCRNCLFYCKDMYFDMGARLSGCNLALYHKNYGLWPCLFSDCVIIEDSCSYFIDLKSFVKFTLKDNFKEVE